MGAIELEHSQRACVAMEDIASGVSFTSCCPDIIDDGLDEQDIAAVRQEVQRRVQGLVALLG